MGVGKREDRQTFSTLTGNGRVINRKSNTDTPQATETKHDNGNRKKLAGRLTYPSE